MDYKEKYEQGLECIQEILSGAGDTIRTSILQKRLQPFFPELKESEDERIRNFLIDFIKICTWTEKKDQGWPSREDCLAWLEKQGENKKLDPDKVIAWLVANICDFEYYVKLFKKDFKL